MPPLMNDADHDEREVVRAVVAGAALLALFECAFVLVFSAPSFEGVAERLTFLGIELSLAIGVGAMLGVTLAGALVLLRRLSLPMRLHVLALCALPVVGYVTWALLRGPRVRGIPGHDAIVVSLAIGLTLAADRVLQSAAKLARRPLSRAVALALVVAGLGLHLVDEWALPRLYPALHRTLELGALASCAAACAAWASRRTWPRLAPLVAMALVGCLPLARWELRHARVVASVLLDRAPTGGAIAKQLLRSSPAKVEPALKTTVAAEPALPPGPSLGSRDIILVTIDALRADRLVPRVMPAASALAATGVRFDEAYTQVPHTSFAVATLLTGKFVYSLSELGLDAASHETLAQVMRRERYKTAAFFPPAVFFIDHDRLVPLEKSAYGFEYVKYEYLDATRRTDQVIHFFDTEKPQRAFVWVHYLEPHEPYDAHDGFTEGTPGGPPLTPGLSDAQRRYEGEIRYVDAELARLLDYLREHRPGALVVLCADHGEEFGEHGGRYHGTTLFDEQVRVPLVMSIVGGDGPLPVRVVPGAVGLVDVAPTLLSLLGVTSSAKMRGRDLSGFMNRTPATPHPRPMFAEIDRKKMIVDGPYKLACDLDLGTCTFYDRAADPGEHRDASTRLPEVAARLRSRLDAFMNDESRFEAHADLPPAQQKLFERAHLGDTTAAAELVTALPTLPASSRHDALKLLATLPPVPSAAPQLADLTDDDALLVMLLRARGGDDAARASLLQRLSGPPLDDELFARIALATRDPAKMADAIQRTEDRALVVSLAAELGESHDPGALDALLIALAPVRSRAEVATALGRLGDRRAIEPLLRWLPNDPYVMVRVAMVQSLSRLAEQFPDERAHIDDGLVALGDFEEEASVLRALIRALGPGRHGDLEIAPSLPPKQGRQRLLFAEAAPGLTLVDGMAIVDERTTPRIAGATFLSRPAR